MINNFNLWLIGFLEAEGSFICASRGDLSFVITQGYRNIAVLYEIKKFLGFGSVIKQSPTVFRFVVQNQIDLLKIINIVNSKLILKDTQERFKIFINNYNLRYNQNIEYLEPTTPIPTLNEAWISGFTDGDGCFNISFIETKDRFYIRFILSQNEDISFFKEVFGVGSIEYNKTYKCWSFVIKDLCTCKDPNNKIVLDYFEKFPLKTSKLNSFYLWKYIMNQLLNTKVTPEKRAALKTLCKLINN